MDFAVLQPALNVGVLQCRGWGSRQASPTCYETLAEKMGSTGPETHTYNPMKQE